MSELLAALQEKFATPQEAMRVLGLSESLLEKGRAGPECFVGDASLPQQKGLPMAKSAIALSRPALLAWGAIHAYLRPKLAADAAIVVQPLLKGVTAKNWRTSKPKIAAALKLASTGKLAADADLEDVIEMLDQLDEVVDDMPAEVVAGTPDTTDDEGVTDEELRAALKAKGLSDEEVETIMAKKPAAPMPGATDTTQPKPEITKAAMDAAIAEAQTRARAETVAHMNAIRAAEQAVKPVVGEIAAMDSADAIYKFALDHLKIDTEGVPAAAFPALLALHKRQTEAAATVRPRPAMDAAAATAYATRFPHANRLGK